MGTAAGTLATLGDVNSYKSPIVSAKTISSSNQVVRVCDVSGSTTYFTNTYISGVSYSNQYQCLRYENIYTYSTGSPVAYYELLNKDFPFVKIYGNYTLTYPNGLTESKMFNTGVFFQSAHTFQNIPYGTKITPDNVSSMYALVKSEANQYTGLSFSASVIANINSPFYNGGTFVYNGPSSTFGLNNCYTISIKQNQVKSIDVYIKCQRKVVSVNFQDVRYSSGTTSSIALSNMANLKTMSKMFSPTALTGTYAAGTTLAKLTIYVPYNSYARVTPTQIGIKTATTETNTSLTTWVVSSMTVSTTTSAVTFTAK